MYTKGFRSAVHCFFVILVASFLASCASSSNVESGKTSVESTVSSGKDWIDSVDKIDPSIGLSRKDYIALLKDKAPLENSITEVGEKQSAFADISDLMISPPEPEIVDDKLVTLSVTDDVPLKDVLVELARRADVDMEIDHKITGGVIFVAKNKPFSEVIKRLANLANLRYSMEDGVLRVERDLPYIVNYRFNLLNMIRTAKTSVSLSTGLGGSGSGGTTSSSGVTSDVESSLADDGDMWSVVEAGVNNILLGSAVASGGAVSASDETQPSGSAIMSVSRQVGIISVLATGKQHKDVKKYLDYIHISHSSQVLIEAKILEVSLDDEYRTGIDWNLINSNVTDLTVRNNFTDLGNLGAAGDQLLTIGVLPAQLFGFNNTSLETTVELVNQFGTSRTLSSPRLHAMNNQYATLMFTENNVYFDLSVEQETDANGLTTLTISSETQTVPIGVMLTIQPSIDIERDEIVMSVRPILSRITGTVNDPGVALVANQNNVNITNSIPIVEIRQLDSVLRIKNGEVMVIGGLMEERNTNTDRGVPGLSSIPIFGNAFKSVVKDSSIVETVIFIKATIIPGEGVSVEDKEFYENFTADRHNFNF